MGRTDYAQRITTYNISKTINNRTRANGILRVCTKRLAGENNARWCYSRFIVCGMSPIMCRRIDAKKSRSLLIQEAAALRE